MLSLLLITFATSVARVQVFYTPGADGSHQEALEQRFEQLTRGSAIAQPVAIGSGRAMEVVACPAGVARVTFADLCAQPLGAADYIALAQARHAYNARNAPDAFKRM